MSLKRATKKARSNVYKYSKLANGSKFTLLNDDVVYTKICDAFALDNDSGKEIIPNLFERVKFHGFQEGYYPLFNA